MYNCYAWYIRLSESHKENGNYFGMKPEPRKALYCESHKENGNLDLVKHIQNSNLPEESHKENGNT